MRVAALWLMALALSACASSASRHESAATLENPRSLAFVNVAHSQPRLPWHFSSEVAPAWRVLVDAAVIQPPTVTPKGRVYITSGRGSGHAHLHAYTAEGEALWESKPMDGLDDLDYGAVLSSPLVDYFGNVYVADLNQVWSFGADGTVRWTSVDFGRYGVDGQLLALRFVDVGGKRAVGGVTASGELLLFERDTGGLLMEVHRFPGQPMAIVDGPPKGLWSDASRPQSGRWLVAEDYVPTLWSVLTGSGQRIRHPLTASPASGRLFVVASAEHVGEARLYGIDVLPQRGALALAADVAFARELPGRHPVGPVVSADGQRVYVIGAHGLQAIDADDGRELWRHRAHQGTALPVAGYDGVLYTIEDGADGSAQISALRGESGRLLWRRSGASLLARALLPHRWHGTATAKVDATPVLASNALWMVVHLGYQSGIGHATQSAMPLPVRSVAVALDLKDGSLRQMFPLQLTFSGQIVPNPNDGATYIASDAWRDTVNFARSLGMPRSLRGFPKPVAGVAAYAPKDRQSLTWEGLQEVSALLDRLKTVLSEQHVDQALARSLSAMAWLQYDISARIADETIDVVLATGEDLGELHGRVMDGGRPAKLSRHVDRLHLAVRQVATLYDPATSPR